MRLYRVSLLAFNLSLLILGQQGNAPRLGSDAPALDYTGRAGVAGGGHAGAVSDAGEVFLASSAVRFRNSSNNEGRI